MKKSSYIIGGLVALTAYIVLIALLEHTTGRIRIHWLGALLLAIGGKHLLSLVCGIIIGGIAALFWDTREGKS